MTCVHKQDLMPIVEKTVAAFGAKFRSGMQTSQEQCDVGGYCRQWMKKSAGFDDFVLTVKRTVSMSKAQISWGPQSDSAARPRETGGGEMQ
jgi:hypothetical protein